MTLEPEFRADGAAQHVSAEARPAVRALAFKLDGICLAVPIEQVSELADCESVTPVPFVKPWVRGVSNVRGSLLPVVDLASYFDKTAVSVQRGMRLIVINLNDAPVGLLTTEVLGMRQFGAAADSATVDDFEPVLRPYLQRVMEAEGMSWGLFDLRRFAAESRFQEFLA
jgi:twitching motility protein PilI